MKEIFTKLKETTSITLSKIQENMYKCFNVQLH